MTKSPAPTATDGKCSGRFAVIVDVLRQSRKTGAVIPRSRLIATIPNCVAAPCSQRRTTTRDKNNRARVPIRRDQRHGNVAAYAAIGDRNARNEATMSNSEHERGHDGGYVLRLGAGFKEKERRHVVEELATLWPHLGRWDSHQVVVDVSLQDRGGKEQRVTLRASLPGFPPLVAVADSPDITHALGEAKHELIRQIEHQKAGREPMNNRRLRKTTVRHPHSTTP
ncbi:hypothetical protein [Mycobacterium marinum]|uniref:hypothetical protein n=1 Tax=Mycobacterium marinum TaxID=1781 RepID=UPI001FB6AF98|nr:hypothetical protein [Mycobacterium marinum]